MFQGRGDLEGDTDVPRGGDLKGGTDGPRGEGVGVIVSIVL